MPLRQRLLLIIGAIVLVLGSLIAYTVLKKEKTETPTPTNETPNDQTPISVPGNTVQATDIPSGMKTVQPSTLEMEQNAVRQFAKTFIERYNSFSTDNNFENIKDVEELVTPALWAKISTRIGTPSVNDNFTAATTEVLSTSLEDWKTDSAKIALKTRKISKQAGQETTVYQTISVSMVKQNNQWLADSFTVQQ